MLTSSLRKALSSYDKILSQEKKPKFKINNNLLDEKIKTGEKILKSCELCEHKCKVNRTKGKLGVCRVGNKPDVSSCFVHMGEEPFLVPSFTIFFMNCTFKCQFCQNWSISQGIELGHTFTEQELAKIIDTHSHCNNVNFVGGDPVPCLPFILKTLKLMKSNLPVVWNSNFYMSEKSMDLLKDMVDVYLSDFKYGNDECAKRLSKIDNYTETVKRNHLLAFKDAELVIRHLVLPSHIECCTKPILDFIAENFKDKAILNLMDQFRPEFNAKNYPEINRLLKTEEFEQAKNYAEKLGLNFIT
ncbi:radical SAM protein [Candidatus Woesearchaeota archaeon]|nr:radical SAM protein [Candidatus Woesearchaeota archaeon]